VRKKALKVLAKVEIKTGTKLEDWKTKKLADIEAVVDLEVE